MLSAGNVVKLVGVDGPKMTVISVDVWVKDAKGRERNRGALCAWFDKNDVSHQEIFSQEALELIP